MTGASAFSRMAKVRATYARHACCQASSFPQARVAIHLRAPSAISRDGDRCCNSNVK
jgi:hypothetical protein